MVGQGSWIAIYIARAQRDALAMSGELEPVGCAAPLLAVNALLMGLLALSFAFSRYSSFEQELWYRYGSLGFLVCGVVIPASAIWAGARRSKAAMTALVVWMLYVFLAFVFYAMSSGGGV